ncbi:MAG: MFS transporter [Lachnospiraceae bacterium]|nr:MFS transporter [Lachnospiraceae bacterium]
MKNTATKKSFFDKLPPSMIKKSEVTIFPEGALGYLVGPTLALLANSILSNYFNAYMSNVLNINAWASAFFTSLPVISVIFVVLGNIIVGRLMDNNTSRAGKARPLLLISVPISLLALVILFIISPFVTDTVNTNHQIMALVCIAIGYNLWFAIAYPMYYTPHASLVNLSTRNSKDRSLLATISNATALAAMGLTSMILPFFLRLLFVYDMSGKGTPVTNDAGVVEYYTDETGAVLYDAQASYEHWKIFVIALVIITVIGALIEYFFTRERVTEESQGEGAAPKKALPIGEQVKICFSDKFWIIMMIFFFLYQLGGMMKNVSQLYFCQAMFPDSFGNYTTANGGTLQGMLSIIGAVPTAIGMVVAWPLSNKIGKGKAILTGAVLAVAGGVLGMLFPTNFPIVVASFVIKALGSTPAMYLSLALLADILDHQEALHGARTDGFTMTIYGAIMAGMTGIATGIMNTVLSGLEYSTSNISSEAIRSAMPWIFIGAETVFYAIIFATFIFMKVEKFGELDHRAIVKDQKAAAEKEGRTYVMPEGMKLNEDEVIDEKTVKEFNELRKANGKSPL